MSIIEVFSLFGIMVVLAAIPSASVALVVTRAATLGISSGFAIAVGIVLGDLIFVMLAILGLSVVAESMGGLFITIKYLGAIYLLWLGFSLLTTKNITTITTNNKHDKSSLLASFFSGLLLTLGDVKAIFFYVSLFPAFIDLSVLDLSDILVIILLTVVSVGGVKIFYAFSATKVASLAQNLKLEKPARKTAGGLMVCVGSYLIVKA